MSLLTRSRRHVAVELVAARAAVTEAAATLDACVPIGSVAWRDDVCVQGRVRSLRIQPWADVLHARIVPRTWAVPAGLCTAQGLVVVSFTSLCS